MNPLAILGHKVPNVPNEFDWILELDALPKIPVPPRAPPQASPSPANSAGSIKLGKRAVLTNAHTYMRTYSGVLVNGDDSNNNTPNRMSIFSRFNKISMSSPKENIGPNDYIVQKIRGYTQGKDRTQHMTYVVDGRGKHGDINPQIKYIKLDFSFPDGTAIITIFRKGNYTIQTTSSVEGQKVIRTLLKVYFPDFPVKLNQELVSTTAKFTRYTCDKKFNIKAIYEALKDQRMAKLPNKANIQYLKNKRVRRAGAIQSWVNEEGNPIPMEKTNALPEKGFGGKKITISLADPHVTLNIFSSGRIIAITKNSYTDGASAIKKLEKYLRNINIFGEASSPNVSSAEKRASKAKALEASRYNKAPSWNAVKANHFVRPDSNGNPVFYKLANPALQKTKTIKAYLAIGKPIPANVRTKLGISNANMKNKSSAKGRPSGWNNQSRNGYYVKPNKNGNPQWYQIPSGKAAAKKKVIESYQSHYVNIPNHIKNMFKIKNENIKSAGATAVPRALQVTKRTKEQLVKEARNLGIPVTSNMNKDVIKNKINYHVKKEKYGPVKGLQAYLHPKANKPNVVIGNVKHTFMANGSIKREYPNKATRTRQFSTLKSNERNAIARAYMSSKRYTEFKKLTAKDQLKFLLNLKNAGGKHSPKTASVKAKSGSASSSLNSAELAFARELENTMLKRSPSVKSKSPNSRGFKNIP